MLLLAVGLAVGCAGPRPRLLPPESVTVAVERIDNRTGEPMVARLLTEEIRRAFRRDGRLKVGEANGAGGCVLGGAVVEYGKRPIRYDSFNVVQEYRLRIVVDLSLVGGDAKRALWRDRRTGAEIGAPVRRIEGDGNFGAVPASGMPAESEEDARRRLIHDLSRNVVRGALEGL